MISDIVFRPILIECISAMALAHTEMGNKLINVATTEAHPPLGNALRKIGRTWHSLADLDQAQAISECVVIGDTLGYQGMNARSAKETLQMRTAVLEEYQTAVKTTISKRRNIERLKASSSIRPDRVDEALEDMEEVITLFLHILLGFPHLCCVAGEQVRASPCQTGRGHITKLAYRFANTQPPS
jgi:Vps5 C terminal like